MNRIWRDRQERAVTRLRKRLHVVAIVTASVQPGGATIKCTGDLLNGRMGTVAGLLIGGAGAPEALILAIRDDNATRVDTTRVGHPTASHPNLAPMRPLIVAAPQFVYRPGYVIVDRGQQFAA